MVLYLNIDSQISKVVVHALRLSNKAWKAQDWNFYYKKKSSAILKTLFHALLYTPLEGGVANV